MMKKVAQFLVRDDKAIWYLGVLGFILVGVRGYFTNDLELFPFLPVFNMFLILVIIHRLAVIGYYLRWFVQNIPKAVVKGTELSEGNK